MNSYEKIAYETSDILERNPEWIDRYNDYADAIISRKNIIKEAKNKFRCWKPFGIYISTAQAKDGKDAVCFSLRYKGQHIAELKVKDGNVEINTDSQTQATNLKSFNCHIVLNNEKWNSDKASAFRNFFKKNMPEKNDHFEHLFESLILEELSKKNKDNFRGIKSIKIGDVRYAMPTPLKASGEGVEYSGRYGGGIDIFARSRTNGQVRLNVLELKDENTKKEPPEKVIKQAIKYAVFVLHLLRSKSGEKWWSLFGFNHKLSEHITINATCIMPKGECNEVPFAKKTINLNGDMIELHYVFFSADKQKEKICVVSTSL